MLVWLTLDFWAHRLTVLSAMLAIAAKIASGAQHAPSLAVFVNHEDPHSARATVLTVGRLVRPALVQPEMLKLEFPSMIN